MFDWFLHQNIIIGDNMNSSAAILVTEITCFFQKRNFSMITIFFLSTNDFSVSCQKIQEFHPGYLLKEKCLEWSTPFFKIW